MAKAGRIVGGILALAGGGLTTWAAIVVLDYIAILPDAIITFAMTLVLGILAILGGILLLLDKTIGGVLAIIAGAVIIAGFFIVINTTFPPVTLTTNWGSQNIGFYLDPLLAIAGGIVGLVVGSE